ncbi:hypothetical protein Rhopal_007648-T1 [Rhodotorula paludigena]|uniref:Uncharacterized protein n=1 Tax=Rhodotorula paludigena TaxID=86838 RepID=A0AAV5GPQ6_9BASI|nr:hypothetical protein Rhopal_007648-T1 [Rhodotorula paludigena]
MSWLRNLNPLTRGSNERVAVLDHQPVARDPWQAKLQLDRDEQRFLSGATELWWVREGNGSTAWEDAVPKLVTAESLLGEHAHLTGQKRNFPHFLYHRTFAGIVEESPTLHKIPLDGSPRWPYANLFSRVLKHATDHPALPADEAHAAHEYLDNPDRSDVQLVTEFPTAFRVFRACLALDDAVVSRGRTRERADDRHGPTLAEVLVATHGEGERHA